MSAANYCQYIADALPTFSAECSMEKRTQSGCSVEKMYLNLINESYGNHFVCQVITYICSTTVKWRWGVCDKIRSLQVVDALESQIQRSVMMICARSGPRPPALARLHATASDSSKLLRQHSWVSWQSSNPGNAHAETAPKLDHAIPRATQDRTIPCSSITCGVKAAILTRSSPWIGERARCLEAIDIYMVCYLTLQAINVIIYARI